MAKMTIEVYQCEICKKAILGSMVGFGDGSGESFVHLHCWEAAQQPLAPDAPPESCEHGNFRGKCPVETCSYSKHGGRR